jgi:hypothetical protein
MFALRISICVLLVVFTSFILAQETIPLSEQPLIHPSPLRIGEKLTFKAKLFGIPAGWQILQTLNMERLNGRDVIHVKSTSQTNDFFSRIYYFSDSRESYIDADTLSPILYRKDITDRKFKAHVEIEFNSGIALVREKGKTRRIEVPPDVQDELSMLFLVRVRTIEPGKLYTFPLLLRKGVQTITVRMIGREELKTVLGKVWTVVLSSSNGHKLWLTDDERRIPVKIEAHTRLGKVVGVLEEVR